LPLSAIGAVIDAAAAAAVGTDAAVDHPYKYVGTVAVVIAATGAAAVVADVAVGIIVDVAVGVADDVADSVADGVGVIFDGTPAIIATTIPPSLLAEIKIN